MPFLTPNDATTDNLTCRRIYFPDDELWVAIIAGLFHDLTFGNSYQPFGSAAPDDCAAIGWEILESFNNGDCMIGSIVPFITDSPPNNHLECNGQTFLREDYPKLYEKIAAALIIDADTAQVPDLRDKFIMGASTSNPALSTGGLSTVSLTESELPVITPTTQPHSHTDTGHIHTAEVTTLGLAEPCITPPGCTPSGVPGTGVTGSASAVLTSETVIVNSFGGGQEHENKPPFSALRYYVISH